MIENGSSFQHRADAYEERIDWEKRLGREIPVLCGVFGPAAGKRILDAGCGPGRHAVALAAAGYSVTGLDLKADMLDAARRHAQRVGQSVTWAQGSYDAIPRWAPGPYDGCFCIGNALAATGTPARVKSALRAFSTVLASGGKLFLQVLNFPPLRKQKPCVRGLRAFESDGKPAITLKVFHFRRSTADVTSITLVNDGGWKDKCGIGKLCAMSPDELIEWTTAAGLTVREIFGDYARSPFDPETSQDVIFVA